MKSIKYLVWIILGGVVFFLSPIYSQEVNSQANLQEELTKLENQLTTTYKEIYNLKQKLYQTPSQELEEKIANLNKKAKQLEKRIENIQKRLSNIPRDKQIEEKWRKKQNPWKRREYPPQNQVFQLRKRLQQTMKELGDIERQLQQTQDKEDREALELYQSKLAEELDNLRQQLSSISQTGWRDSMRERKTGWGSLPRERRFQQGFPPFNRRREFRNWKRNPLLERLRSHLTPEQIEELRTLREENPRAFKRKIRKYFQKMRRKQRRKIEDPKITSLVKQEKELNKQLEKTLKKLPRLAGEERQQCIEEIRTKLYHIFDIRQEMREYKLKKMEQQLQRRREALEKRKSNKEIIVDRQLKKLIGEGEEWEW